MSQEQKQGEDDITVFTLICAVLQSHFTQFDIMKREKEGKQFKVPFLHQNVNKKAAHHWKLKYGIDKLYKDLEYSI